MGFFIRYQFYFSPNKSVFGREVLSSQVEEPQKKSGASRSRATRLRRKSYISYRNLERENVRRATFSPAPSTKKNIPGIIVYSI